MFEVKHMARDGLVLPHSPLVSSGVNLVVTCLRNRYNEAASQATTRYHRHYAAKEKHSPTGVHPLGRGRSRIKLVSPQSKALVFYVLKHLEVLLLLRISLAQHDRTFLRKTSHSINSTLDGLWLV